MAGWVSTCSVPWNHNQPLSARLIAAPPITSTPDRSGAACDPMRFPQAFFMEAAGDQVLLLGVVELRRRRMPTD